MHRHLIVDLGCFSVVKEVQIQAHTSIFKISQKVITSNRWLSYNLEVWEILWLRKELVEIGKYMSVLHVFSGRAKGSLHFTWGSIIIEFNFAFKDIACSVNYWWEILLHYTPIPIITQVILKSSTIQRTITYMKINHHSTIS
jgi:hypothetical protein